MRVTVSPEQIRSAFEAVKDDPSFDESRGLWERGKPPVEMIQAMCLRPEILAAFAGFGNSVYPGGLLERRVKELVIITASHTNECQFCTFSHCDLVDIADIVDEPLIVIEHTETLAPRERLAVAYTRAAMADSNAIPSGDQRGAQGAVQRSRDRRTHVPHRLHQHAEPVQQLSRGPLPRGVQRPGAGRRIGLSARRASAAALSSCASFGSSSADRSAGPRRAPTDSASPAR